MWKPRQWEVKYPWHVGRVGSQYAASTLPGLCGCTFSSGHRLWWCSSVHPLSAFILQLPCWESTSQENRTLWSFASRGVRWTAAGFPQAVEMNGQTGAGMMGRDFGRRVPTEGGLCTFRLALFIRNTKCLVSRSSQTSVAWKVTALHSHSWQAG